MQVLKFGGSSVANAVNISKVVSIVADATKKDRTIMVSSAISGCTDKLIKIGNLASKRELQYKELVESLEKEHNDIIQEIIPEEYRAIPVDKCNALFSELKGILEGVALIGELTESSCDLVMSFGELLSTSIISAKLKSLGINNVWTDSRTLIKTFRENSRNVVNTTETYNRICAYLETNGTRLYVVPGFIASDANNKTTTLGRGGSDYTASLFAAAAGARVLEIWTDVSGMMTADPRLVPDAKTIEHISYKEALELSHFGAKVVYPPTIQPVVKRGIPIIVKNTFDPYGPATVIENHPPDSRGKIRGISGSNNIALLSLEGSGMVGIPGYSARFFTALANKKINIILITQASSLHTMCVAIEGADAGKAGKAVDIEFAYEISLGKVNPVVVEEGFSIISLVGDDMKNQSGTSGKMFDALGKAGINIRAIAQGSSERNVSAIVDVSDTPTAIKVIHDKFFGEAARVRVNLFIAGYGNVGKSLVKLVEEQKERIAEEKGAEIVLAGVCNSTHSLINKEGLTSKEIEKIKETGNNGGISNFLRKIISMAPGNPVFADCTADSTVASLYSELLSAGISVVTCNKITPSSSLDRFRELKKTAAGNGLSLLYETTAGAALPILRTIERLKESGEKIIRAEAILSGTLNYLYSNYNGTKTFASLVKEAQDAGYTEPDPRTDLSGTDVIRKCTIIARECGFRAEQKDIAATPAAPEELFEGTVADFYNKTDESESKFKDLYLQSAEKGERLRYVATIEDGKYNVGLVSLPSSHPLYNVCGTNNSVTFITTNYPDGITITGAGAGARVTAGGVLNDIIKAAL